MESKPKFLVYDRREIWVLFLLGLFVALFAFTLGLHFGRRLQNGQADADHPEKVGEPIPQPLQEEAEDKVAGKDDFPVETPQGVREMSQQVMDESTAEQVEVQDLRLKEPKALELPEKAKSENSGGTTQAQAEGAEHGKNTHVMYPKKLEKKVVAPAKKKTVSSALAMAEKEELHSGSEGLRKFFVLQVGSYPDEPSAESKVTELKSTGIDAMIEKATVKELGLRFRVLVGKFPSRKSADQAGKNYQSKKMIEQYFVSTRALSNSDDASPPHSGDGESSGAAHDNGSTSGADGANTPKTEGGVNESVKPSPH